MAQLHEKSDNAFLNQERHAILQQSFSAAKPTALCFLLAVADRWR